MDFGDVTLKLLDASKYTLGLFAMTLAAAIPLGMLVCACAVSKLKLLKYLTGVFIWIIRGTPLMLQIMVVFYVPGLLFGAPVRNRFLAAFIAFAINYAAYFAEIYRGGLESIPSGQYDACKALGMSKFHTNVLVVFPQVFKKILPSASNEVITLVKDTSLANVIGIPEIIMSAKGIVSTKAIIWPLFYTGVFYLVMVGALTALLKLSEKKLGKYKEQ